MKNTIKLPKTITPQWLNQEPRKSLLKRPGIASALGVTEGTLRYRKEFSKEEQATIKQYLKDTIESGANPSP